MSNIDDSVADTCSSYGRPISADAVLCRDDFYTPKTLPNNIVEHMWIVQGDTFFPGQTTTNQLPPGQYTVGWKNETPIFKKKSIVLDNLLHLPDDNMQRVLDSLDFFWGQKEVFNEMGFLWKRGIFLYGPPGSGKTSLIQLISQKVIDKGGIAVYGTIPEIDAAGLSLLRKIEPNRPIVMMLEDLDAIVHEYGESKLLAMLDGELQVDNVVFVATTNYPERLDKRITNRPSRFDERIKIDMPNDAVRDAYIAQKNPRLTDAERKLWVRKTEGFSLAHIRDLVVSVECLNCDFNESVERLNSMFTDVSSNDYNKKNKLGFT